MTRVLVVEDEAAIAELLREMLEEEGYEVALAQDGRVALGLVMEARPDLVVSDVMMPVLDGRALCRILQADPRSRSIPIMLMSAARQPIADERCRPAAFVQKPFNLSALLMTIARLIGTAHLPSHEQPSS